jgi:hypothetical protein
MQIVRSVVIDCHIEDVFDYVADPRHRPLATCACVASERPHRIAWRSEDDEVIEVTYELESVWTATRLTRRDDARFDAPRLLQPLARIRHRRDVARRLRALKGELERRRAQ